MAGPPTRDGERRLWRDDLPPNDTAPSRGAAVPGVDVWGAVRVSAARYVPHFTRNWRLVLAAIFGLIMLVTGGKFLRPFIRGYTVSDELLGMDQTHRALAAANDARADELRFYATPEGKELIARRKGMLAPGEVLVNPIPKPAVAPPPTPLTPQQVVQLWIAEWRQNAAAGVHHTEAVIARWAVDPPEVKAAQEQARERRSKKSGRKQKPG